MKNIAVILSGGSGSRFGGSLPKQFTKLAGKSIIEYTVGVFENAQAIDEILIVSESHHVDRTWDLVKKNGWVKVTKVIHGGKERFDSTYSALKALEGMSDDSKLLLHDAVRPLVDQSIITQCIEALDEFDAVDVVIPSDDTLVELYDDGCIANIPNRAMMGRGQTPQAFRLGCLGGAYAKAIEANRRVFTCDCGVVRAMLPHVRVATVRGSEKNRKVTHPIDLFIAEKFLQAGAEIGTQEFDGIKALQGKNIVIFGGSSGIGLEMRNIAIAHGASVDVASRRTNGVDICDLETVREYLATVAEKSGEIDFIVNTAGLLIKKPIDSLSLDEIKALVGINYTGAVNVAIASKPYLGRSHGMLLNFTSSSYTRGRALYAMYSSTNAAVVNLTQALAEEWQDDGVRVNCINPERTATPMRTSNFGVEPAELLLDAKHVARTSLNVLLSHLTGIVVDVRKDGR